MANKKWIPNKKNNYNPPECKDERLKFVAVGCGKCVECKRQRSRGYAVRLQEEIKTDKSGQYVTLTFSNEAIQELAEGIEIDGYERDNAIAIKAVRRFLERWRKRTKKSVKHWLITELGHEGTENIHLHGIIFTNEKEKIETTWQYGFVRIGEYVNNRTVNYCIKYVTKQDGDHKFYEPKILSSPGIGRNYINRADSKRNLYRPGGETRETWVADNGKKLNLPTYYRNKIYTEEEREKLWIEKLDKGERYVLGIKAENMEHYWAMVNEARAKNDWLGFGNNEKNWDRIIYENNLRNLKFRERITKLKQNDME